MGTLLKIDEKAYKTLQAGHVYLNGKSREAICTKSCNFDPSPWDWNSHINWQHPTPTWPSHTSTGPCLIFQWLHRPSFWMDCFYFTRGLLKCPIWWEAFGLRKINIKVNEALLQLLSIHWICIYICKLVQTQWWTIASNDKYLYNTDYIVNTASFKLGGNPFCDLKLERSVYSEEVISSLSSRKNPPFPMQV